MFHIGIATQHPPLPEPGQLSELGIDFIESCLCLDFTERPTASELLQHPWLASMVQTMSEHHEQSPGVASLTSTLVDHDDSCGAHLSEDVRLEQAELASGLSSLSISPSETAL
jgi:mitogen-activated protein kinase kinase kinase